MPNTKFSDIKYIEGFDSWAEMLDADINSIVHTIYNNISADLDAGHSVEYVKRIYDNALKAMDEKRKAFDDMFIECGYDNNRFQRYCYIQLLKSGAIE